MSVFFFLSLSRSQSSNADPSSLDYLLFDSNKTDLNASADHRSPCRRRRHRLHDPAGGITGRGPLGDKHDWNRATMLALLQSSLRAHTIENFLQSTIGECDRRRPPLLVFTLLCFDR